MFRFHKPKDIITVFHKASSPASTRVVTLLKQVSANATETATEDQASDHTAQSDPKRPEFDLDVTESAPTSDQLRSILEYVGTSNIGSVIAGASTEKDALKKFKEGAENFKRPVIVDWNNGRALASENESEILKMVNELNKS
ncbi:thioredoxin-like protein [Pestalotiopsis sp. NC0098]|nr:thioredoxin-like protein [Pestalotiopsis sp. NC0098]